jgi:integrase
MLKKPYSLWKRKLPSGSYVYYIRFRLDDGSWRTAKSSGQTTKTAAEAWAINYLKSGQIILKHNITFSSFAKDFFSDEGDFMQIRSLRGKNIGKSHTANLKAYLKNYLIPYFGQKKLTSIDEQSIEAFTRSLADKGLATSTINHILHSLKMILEEAHKRKLTQKLVAVEMVTQRSSSRGVLSFDEARSFFNLEWTDRRMYAINLLAATTGMRLGEIRGLQRQSVFPTYVDVCVSWEKGHGLKGTKTGSSRYVPIPERTSRALQEVIEKSPYTDPEDFVFFGRYRNAPLDHRGIERNFHKALESIGIDEKERKKRNICFHSWRHFFNSLLINGRVPVVKVQTLTGHL